MFLIASADQRFWKTDEPVLFLGEWCKLYSKKALWQNIQHEVLEYHWDDRKKLYTDYRYLQEVYERKLIDLAGSLNAIHKTDHSLRYWRILIGPWLFFFVQVFYDRYACIEKASKSSKVTGTLIGKYGQDEWVPKDYDEFSEWVPGDTYNQFLYGWIIEHIKPFPYSHLDTDNRAVFSDKEIRKNTSGGESTFRKLILAYERCLPHRFNKYVFISSYLSPKDQCLLQLSLGQWPSCFAPEITVPTTKLDWSARSKLSWPTSEDQFEMLLSQVVFQQIPRAYVEDYSALKEQALAKYPKHPKVILTATDSYANEGFKIYSAENVEREAKLAVVQHGGNYGTTLFSAGEEHEIKISNDYYTWGWKSDVFSNTRPLVGAKLNWFKKNIIPDTKGKILLTLGIMPRYAYHLYSVYVSSTGALAYFNDQFSFIRGLNADARKDLLIRASIHDYEWSQQDRFKEFFPDAVFDHRKSIVDSMKKSRLCVTTYNSTTYLETFTANFPTIMFWNPEHWELRDSAKPYFDRLRAVGILHDTPRQAAEKINEIFMDPGAWWHREDVQEAKNYFCSRFANTSDHWLEDWRREMRTL